MKGYIHSNFGGTARETGCVYTPSTHVSACFSTPLPTLCVTKCSSCQPNSDMSLLISRTSVIISGTRYLFMFINMFIFLSLFKSFTQVDFKSFLCIKMLALFSVVGVRSPPLGYGLSSDLVSGVLNHIGYVFIVHMFILESSLLYSPTKSSLISCTQMYVNFLSKRRNQTEKLRIGHQKSFP